MISSGRRKLHLKLRSMVRPGGYVVLAGTPEDLRKGLGLAIAQFAESVTPTLYQSRHDARKRATLLIAALRQTGDFQ
jgi:hypothetical protein